MSVVTALAASDITATPVGRPRERTISIGDVSYTSGGMWGAWAGAVAVSTQAQAARAVIIVFFASRDPAAG
ncbi:hypothetical protein [Nonomuraea sp. NPDC049758]|uniref:hypothetical protein n=1 Tax=Nonomuraea sp. NPDC049758 TaxID=3154360 RepID=UPI00341C3B70